MSKFNILFLGGFFINSQRKFIEDSSIGVIQNAADVLQRNLIFGIDSVAGVPVVAISIPFVGSFPGRFRTPFFPAASCKTGNAIYFTSRAFLNISVLKIFSRFFSAISALAQQPRSARTILFVYSAHIPFLVAALLFRVRRSEVKICLIIPDLPEYMGGQGLLYSILKKIDCTLFYRLAKMCNYFVVLTKGMIDRIGADPEKSIVIEGVSTEEFEGYDFDVDLRKSRNRSFLYTGTLARRYGILGLIEAFRGIENPDVELWICGDGDGRDIVVSAAAEDTRIKYFGQIARRQVMSLQRRSTILINPRTPEGEYTKYSFPSKIIEYMAAGRPVIMHRLDGIPPEYYNYCFSPKSSEVLDLANCMRHALTLSDNALSAIGCRAKDFVTSQKNPTIQAQKILKLVLKEN